MLFPFQKELTDRLRLISAFTNRRRLILSKSRYAHTLHFPISISTVPYRKVMIAKICFRKILTLSASSSVYSSDFTTTVASYFGINTESAKREAEVAVTSIRKDVFAFLISSALD